MYQKLFHRLNLRGVYNKKLKKKSRNSVKSGICILLAAAAATEGQGTRYTEGIGTKTDKYSR